MQINLRREHIASIDTTVTDNKLDIDFENQYSVLVYLSLVVSIGNQWFL